MYVWFMSLETTLDAGAGAPGASSDPERFGAPTMPPIVEQMCEDEELSKTDLVEIIAHCASVRASADYRMLQAISLIHEEHEEDYGSEIGEAHPGPADSPEDLHALATLARSGGNPRARFGPDGLERTIADVGAVLSVSPAKARELITAGHAVRYRLPLTGSVLACGRLDLSQFLIVLSRTALCGPDTIADVDARIASALLARNKMSTTRLKALVDSVVAQLDPPAVKRQRELVEHDRDVQVRPDRHQPGQSRISGTLPIESGVMIDARLNAMADAVHDADPRTHAQRRADALTAFAHGESHLTCRCEACALSDDLSEAVSEPTDDLPDQAAAPAQMIPPSPRAIIHVVVNESTINGDDDKPGFIDGHGVVDAETIRKLLTDAGIDFLDPATINERAASSALRYTPSKKLDALIRSGELCCTFPGCSNPVWRADVDHGEAFNRSNPQAGGATVAANLKPLCRFHHRIKTFGNWRDLQTVMGTTLFVSPTGHTFVGNAFTGFNLFRGLRRLKPPDHPANRRINAAHDAKRRRLERAEKRWNDENPPPY